MKKKEVGTAGSRRDIIYVRSPNQRESSLTKNESEPSSVSVAF